MKIFKKLRKENVDMQNITDRVKKNSTSDFEEELQKPNNLSPKPVALWDLVCFNLFSNYNDIKKFFLV